MGELTISGDYIICSAVVAERDQSLLAVREVVPDHIENSINIWKDEKTQYVITKVAINIESIDSFYDAGHGLTALTTKCATYSLYVDFYSFVSTLSTVA